MGGLTVTGLDLRVDLDATVLRNHLFGNGDALVDRDALIDNRVVLHAAPPLASVDRSTRRCGETYLDMLSMRSIFEMPSQCRIYIV